MPSTRTQSSLLASHRRLLISAAMLGLATVLVKLVALGKDWLVARQIGAGDELDAYLIAFMIPSFGVAVLGHSFASAFVPMYVRLCERQSAAAARRLVDGSLLGGFVVLVCVALLFAVGANYLLPLVGSGFNAQKLALARSLFYVMVGVLVVSGISSIFAAVLNAHERFAVTAIAPVTVPMAMLVGFWLLQERYGIYALAGGTLVGFIIECKVLGVAAWRLGLIGWPRWTGVDDSLAHVASQYWPVLVGSLLMTSSAVVDQSMAASLAGGNVSILSYGGKIVALVLSMVAASLATVLFPRFARLIAAGSWDELSRTITACAKYILMGSIPLVAALALLAEPMIGLLFERGAFTPASTIASGQVQAWLSLQVPFYVLAMLGARVLSAMDANQIVLRIGALNLALNVAGNYVLMQWFGVNGIAMSTSLMYLVAAVVTLVAVRAKIQEAGGRRLAAGGRSVDDVL